VEEVRKTVDVLQATHAELASYGGVQRLSSIPDILAVKDAKCEAALDIANPARLLISWMLSPWHPYLLHRR
jgi:ribosomal protein S2